MADKWQIVCMDCLQRMNLGKLIRFDETGSPISPRFWGPEEAVGPRSRQLRSIEQFVGVHLGHVLGTVTSDSIVAALEGPGDDADPFQRVGLAELEAADWADVADPNRSAAAELLRERLGQRLIADGGANAKLGQHPIAPEREA